MAKRAFAAFGLSDPATRLLIANLYASRGLSSEAVEQLESLFTTAKEPAVARLLGSLYLGLGLSRLAEDRYLQALDLAQTANDIEGQAADSSALATVVRSARQQGGGCPARPTGNHMVSETGGWQVRPGHPDAPGVPATAMTRNGPDAYVSTSGVCRHRFFAPLKHVHTRALCVLLCALFVIAAPRPVGADSPTPTPAPTVDADVKAQADALFASAAALHKNADDVNALEKIQTGADTLYSPG